MIEFSKSGHWFAIYLKAEQKLRVFKSKDIMECFKNIEMDKPDFCHEFDLKKYGQAERIIFDKNDKFVAV